MYIRSHDHRWDAWELKLEKIHYVAGYFIPTNMEYIHYQATWARMSDT